MSLEELVNSIPGFYDWKDAEKIRFFAWFQRSKNRKERFQTKDIKACYEKLDLAEPSSISPFLTAMKNRKPSEVLFAKTKGYALEKRVRNRFEKEYGQRPAEIQIDTILTELPSKVPDLAERDFLEERNNHLLSVQSV